MTSNQNAAKANEIAEERAAEESRSNKAKEKETQRANKAQENLARRGQNMKGFTDALGAFGKLVGKINDPSWYNKDPQLVKDVASFAFGSPLGSTKDNFVNTFIPTEDNEEHKQYGTEIAGVMNLLLTTTIPNTTLMKTIGDKYYAFVRHANSGSRNYEANDLMMYLLAATECYAQLAHATKIYSILNTYKRENWYYSRGFLKSIGISDRAIDEFLGHLSDFRSRLNVLIRRVNAFYIPNTFPLFARKVWLQLNIFKDHPTKRTSNYIFSPYFILLYTETADNLRLDANQIDYSSYDAYILQLENMVDRIYASEDLGIMSGDILKAYKDSGIYSVTEIPEDFHIEETYSPEVLSQINSATVIGTPVREYAGIFTRTTSSGSFIAQGKYDDVSTLNGYRIQNIVKPNPIFVHDVYDNILKLGTPSTDIYQYPEHQDAIVNMYKDDVTPDDVMVASRLMAVTQAYKSDELNKPIITLKSSGDCVVNLVKIVRINKVDGELQFKNINVFDLQQEPDPAFDNDDSTEGGGYAMDEFVRAIPTFDWAPRLRLMKTYGKRFTTDNGYTVEMDHPIIIFDNFDYANYMRVSKENIANMHKVALMSMFNI